MVAPMAGATSAAMVAAAAERGALGSLPLGYCAPDEIAVRIADVRALTTRPFACNLFVDTAPAFNAVAVAGARAALRPYREALGLSEPEGPVANERLSFDDQVEAVFAARPAVVSFTFGIPSRAVLEQARELGIFTIATANTVDEAIVLEAAGCDALCVQGFEAGGHHGAFLGAPEDAHVGTLALVADAVSSVRLPVIAAGGIGDGRGIAAVLALGAEAAQIGSAFLLANESAIAPAYRAALRGPDARRTVFTTAFSGRAARGIRNRMTDELANSTFVAPYPDQNALTRGIRTAAARAGRAEFLSLWAGQAVSLAREESTAAIITRLMREARDAAETSAAIFRGIPGRNAYAQPPMETTDGVMAHEQLASPEAAVAESVAVAPVSEPEPIDHPLPLEEPVHSMEAKPIASTDAEPIASTEAEPSPGEAVVAEPVADAKGAPRSLGVDPAVVERKRKAQESWDRAVAAHASGEIVQGIVTTSVKGGLLVDVDGVRGFLPASQASPGAGAAIETLLKQHVPLKIIDVDVARKRVVVSHRRAAESQKRAARSTLLRSLAVGQRFEATVVRLADFGAFVDIGSGVDGLVPMSELAFERVEKVGDLLAIGDKFEASIIRIEEGGRKIALSRKAALPDPWRDHADVVRIGATIEGKVVAKDPRLQVEIAPGIVGMVRDSDADPAEYEIGESIEVSVRNLDRRTRKITLTTLHGAAAAIVTTSAKSGGFASLGEELSARAKKR